MALRPNRPTRKGAMDGKQEFKGAELRYPGEDGDERDGSDLALSIEYELA